MTSVPGWAVVDLFCGIGGLSHGFRQAGFNVVAGVDADETCRFAYETNNDAKFVGRPLEEVSGDEIGKMFPDGSSRVLIGCAPCTPFSAYTAANGQSLVPASTSDKPSTVRDAIGQMPALNAGDVNPEDAIHRASRLSTLNLRRIRAAKPGGSWSEWEDPDLVSPCHRRSSGATYRNVYGRMEWDKPAPTLTTGCFSFGRGRFGHPEQDRAISLREAALLQSFPPTYGFTDPDESVWFARVGRHIGNAVPVALAVAIANAVHTHIEDNTP